MNFQRHHRKNFQINFRKKCKGIAGKNVKLISKKIAEQIFKRIIKKNIQRWCQIIDKELVHKVADKIRNDIQISKGIGISQENFRKLFVQVVKQIFKGFAKHSKVGN